MISAEDRPLAIAMGVLVLTAVLVGVIFVTTQRAYAPGSAPAMSTIAPSSPTPSPRSELWRYEGVVTDPDGRPVPGVCIAIGPRGCQRLSPRTDERGVWFFDFPHADVNYDLHFMRVGFITADRRVHPSGPAILNVVLERG